MQLVNVNGVRKLVVTKKVEQRTLRDGWAMLRDILEIERSRIAVAEIVTIANVVAEHLPEDVDEEEDPE